LKTEKKNNLKPFRVVLLLAALMLYTSLGFAEINATVTAATDYVFRGYSKTHEDFAIQANLDYEHGSGLYLGTSVSNVDFGDNNFRNAASVEITPYLGWTFTLSDDFRLDLQWTRYLYDGDIYGNQSDYNEFYAFLHYRDLITARVAYSEDFYSQDRDSFDYELTGRYPITDTVEFSTGVGYSLTEDILEYDYLYWNAGLTYFMKHIAFDLRYLHAIETSTNEDTKWPYEAQISNPSLVFSVSVGF
jgi:uncharacterized protein (TIGR02001 family)